MYGCILIPPEMSLVFAQEPPHQHSSSSASPPAPPPSSPSSSSSSSKPTTTPLPSTHSHPNHHHNNDNTSVVEDSNPQSPTSSGSSTPPLIKSSLLANSALTPGTVFYPDDGDIRLELIADHTIMTQNNIRREFGGYDVMLRVDGREVRHCNWVRFVKRSEDPETANIICSKGRGQVHYYQVVKPVRINQELIVYFKTTPERERSTTQRQQQPHSRHQSSQVRSNAVGPTMLPTDFPSQSLDPSIFNPRQQIPPFPQQPHHQQQTSPEQYPNQQQCTDATLGNISGNRTINSPVPAMLLRHYDKIMTSTPINTKRDVKSASSCHKEDYTTNDNTNGNGTPTLTSNSEHNHPPPPPLHCQHHIQQLKNNLVDSSSSILSNISLSSSFSSSPMTKMPQSPSDGVDYSITKPTRNDFSNSFSLAMMSSSVSHDNEKVSSKYSTQSIKREENTSDMNKNNDNLDNINNIDNANDKRDDNSRSLQKKKNDKEDEEDSNAENKSDNSGDIIVVINDVVKKESEDENDNENVSFVHESRGVKYDNTTTTTDDTEDDIDVDVDSTGVDLGMQCDNNVDNEDDDKNKNKKDNGDHCDLLKSDSVKNELLEKRDFIARSEERISDYKRLAKCDISVGTVQNSFTNNIKIHDNDFESRRIGFLANVGRDNTSRGTEDLTSEQQITSSTPFIPAMKTDARQRFDQSDSTIETFDMSHGSNSSQSQSQPLDCSTDHKLVRCANSSNEIMYNIKPERMISGLSPNEAALMTSREGKPIKRCRERSWWPCDMCGKKFDRPSLLKRHIRTHTGEKPHACDVCGKAFSTSSSLNTHRRIHSGEKPHQCKVCGKRFTASSNLYYHRMTHNKEKPHKCTLCSKSFPTPGDLRSHQYIHSGSWPFRCHVCNRGFSKQTNLRNHMMLHSGDKPHECSRCGKKFALLCNLKTHYKTHDSSDSSDVTDGSKCDDSTEDTTGHLHYQDNYKDNTPYKGNDGAFINTFSDKGEKESYHNKHSPNYPSKHCNTINNLSDEQSSSLKRKLSQTDLPQSLFTTYRYTEPNPNPTKIRRHTDFSISKITSSDDKVSKSSKSDVADDDDSDVIKRSLPKDIENTVLSDQHELLNSISAANASLTYPLMYKHLMAAAASSQQQQLQYQQHQQQPIIQPTADLQQLQQHHQQWLMSQHPYNKLNINNLSYQPFPFHPAVIATPNAFQKPNLFPIPMSSASQLSSSSSSPLPFHNNITEESNTLASAPRSSSSSSSPFTVTGSKTAAAKFVGGDSIAYNTATATPMATVPVFFKPEMMSLHGGGAYMSRIPTISTLPAFWGGHMTANGF